MKKSLSHLPKHKQDEIRAVAELIKERIDAEFIILFGSYARGDWVETFMSEMTGPPMNTRAITTCSLWSMTCGNMNTKAIATG